MKQVINSALQLFIGRRHEDIYRDHQQAADVQEEQFEHLLRKGIKTEWGAKHEYAPGMDIAAFQEKTPLSTYEEFFPWIERALQGEKDLLWPGLVTKFAKSSGTTNARSKYIPVTEESLQRTHYRGGKDTWIFYLNQYHDAGAHLGKTVGIGGSLDETDRKGVQVGDLSAILMNNLPRWAQKMRTPDLSIAMMPDWDTKLEAMAEELVSVDVRSLAGVPTWTLLLVQKIIEDRGVSSIREIWPKLEVFFHGAVAFDPYRSLCLELFGADMRYLELYNASEGFFGIQDDPNIQNEMLLMLDYGIFYEFIPENGDPITIHDVQVGVPYELVISTNGGLWRYRIGDVIEFTNLNPYRIKISGRTKHFINAFGEELMVANAEQAVAKAAEATNALVQEYTAGPAYMGEGLSGYHEWVFEFAREPEDTAVFTKVLDEALREVNSDYDAKRKGDIALSAPKIHTVQQGTFRNFLESRGEITGRNKVPRLANHREFLEKILTIS